ncbi:prepilin-type N-terminal cleavage/methylation domain-containing protein [Microaerobacter geothermalis]|uniref:type IV pilus modification PilV family protein n=1 Tax=Microaerobacter geothermalis TaxID=674972 RepID=UPI001F22C878|nr:prepilin-type N-terminal cleavage/methylation domain-containing protein [Microaerobacter geothermalis]MCF6094207.1 prepilin-type N-terminal cleavage/methylation domain-containing protein [Microaerobacter geothermalis]
MRSYEEGFSLLETLISITIAMMVVIPLYSYFQQILLAWDSLSAEREAILLVKEELEKWKANGGNWNAMIARNGQSYVVEVVSISQGSLEKGTVILSWEEWGGVRKIELSTYRFIGSP